MIQVICKVCGKTLHYDPRGAREVSCQFCYTDFKVDRSGKLIEIEIAEGPGPELAGADASPASAKAPAAGADKKALARLLDEGDDRHLTFIKDGEAMAPAAPAPIKAAAPVVEEPSGPVLDFADDAPRPKAKPPKSKGEPEKGKSKAKAEPPAKSEKRSAKPDGKIESKPKPPPLTRAKEIEEAKEAAMDAEVDRRQRVILGIVTVVALVVIVGGIIVAMQVITTATGNVSDTDTRSDTANPGTPANTPVAQSDLPAISIAELRERVEKLLACGTYTDAAEAALLAESANRTAGLSPTDRGSVENLMRVATSIRDSYRLLEQARMHLARAAQGLSPLQVRFEKYFAAEVLRRLQTRLEAGPEFETLRQQCQDTLSKAEEQ